ncbi:MULTISPECIES: TIR domain-containing protein [Kutzneria]|uniref:TIR domain-containing protein n=1 Tax=Kutzneria TaxID=43356 RepID=UPI00228760A3|nr:TIR domain-containing protein [Kutzneria albida]
MNFRVGDAQDSAVLIDQKLCRHFGEDAVFRSSRSISPATLFDPELLKAVNESAVVLVVIGPNWLTVSRDGEQRIFAPADWVRTEIEIATAGNKSIIPILVGEVTMPLAKDLPPTISSLASRQYVRLHHRSAERDLTHIVDAVREKLADRERGVKLPKATNSVLLTSLGVTQRSADIKLGAADINGRHYSDSIVYQCRDFAHEPQGSISFNLGMNYRKLEVTAGVLDNAADPGQTGVFQVITDGQVRKEVTVRQGQPQNLTIDVSDVLNLRLLVYRPGTTVHPMLAGARLMGGQSNYLPELAWGKPVLHP